MFVNVTIPVHNEADRLPPSIPILHKFLSDHCRFDWEIVIADNASSDRTPEIAEKFCREYSKLRLVRLQERGRGRALKAVWSESQADILSYMDVDLSTNLYAFPPMIEALICGGFDLGVGSRLQKASSTKRCCKRTVISRTYNTLVKVFFQTRFSDAQCGFKAVTRTVGHKLLPKVLDTNWFFDTELLVIAEKSGYRIFELPVSWIEDLDTKIKIGRDALEHVRELIRLRRTLEKVL